VHALLFLAAMLLLLEVPGADATTDEIADFYDSAHTRAIGLVGLYLMPFAGIAFIWFIVALRMWISGAISRENVLLSNVQLVSGMLYVALFFAAGGCFAVVAAGVEFSDAPISATFARQFPQYGTTLIWVFAFRMAAMFVFTTSSIGRATGILPRWYTLAGYAVGLFLLLSASFVEWFVLVFPIWLLVLTALLLRRARQIPADIVLPGPAPTGTIFPGPGSNKGARAES
jgi:hypothetical protein